MICSLSDDGDNVQGAREKASDTGSALVVMVIVLVTVMARTIVFQSITSVECHMNLKLGEKWNQAVGFFISLLMPSPGHFLQYRATGSINTRYNHVLSNS